MPVWYSATILTVLQGESGEPEFRKAWFRYGCAYSDPRVRGDGFDDIMELM